MEYYDWFIITSAMIIIVFITLLGLSVLERDLKKDKWLLWFSLAGLIVSIAVTGVIIWYYHKKYPGDTNNSVLKKEPNKSVNNGEETPETKLVDILNKEGDNTDKN
jgi:O-antigen/teichoic acid export membrane protein